MVEVVARKVRGIVVDSRGQPVKAALLLDPRPVDHGTDTDAAGI